MRRRRPPMRREVRARALCLFLAAALIALAAVGTVHLRSILGNLAVTRVSNTVSRVVTEAVIDTLSDGEIRYDELICVVRDNAGQVAALQSNMAEFNRLQAAIAQDVLERLGETADTDLSIPVGTLTGSPLLAGRGPSLTVRMQSTGSCAAHFENEFENAGINQTTHRILLYVDVSMSILLPGFRTSTQVGASFAVAETVIVGSVPDSYTYFDSGNDASEDAYEYSINRG